MIPECLTPGAAVHRDDSASSRSYFFSMKIRFKPVGCGPDDCRAAERTDEFAQDRLIEQNGIDSPEFPGRCPLTYQSKAVPFFPFT